MKHLLVIAATLLVTAGTLRAGDLFADAEFAPPDVTLYVHVESAAGLRAAIAARPIAGWIDAWLGRGQLPAAWQRFCAAAGMPPAALFDACVGRRVTLLSRGGEPPEWVLLSDVDPAASAALLQRLEAQVLAPRDDAGLFQLEAHDLIVARRDGRLLAAPRAQPGLLYDVLARMARPAPSAALAAGPAIAEGRRLGEGCAALVLRHAPPLGGWSVGVAGLRGERIAVRHASHFESAPFRSRVTALAWDPAPLAGLEAQSILAFIEPGDITGGPLDAFMQAALGVPGPAQALGSNLGPRLVTAVSGLGVARAYEVHDAGAARGQLDSYMARLLPALAALAPGAEAPSAPEASAPGAARCARIGGVAQALLGDVPGAEGLSICWAVAEATPPAASWCIVASTPSQIEGLAAALAAPAPAGSVPADRGPWTSCGTFDGRRLAAQMGDWRKMVERQASPMTIEAFDLLVDFAAGVQLGTWRLSRPAAECLRAEAEIVLAPPESAGPAPAPAAPGP
jgi:hypothetical protein